MRIKNCSGCELVGGEERGTWLGCNSDLTLGKLHQTRDHDRVPPTTSCSRLIMFTYILLPADICR